MFIKGNLYCRRDLHALHALYGGQQQSGISTPSAHPFIFLFTSPRSEEYGYIDGWQKDGVTFLYTGERQRGDMTFTRGNRAIRDHVADGKALHLFEKADMGYVRYVNQMICRGYRILQGRDVDGQQRAVIVFILNAIE